MGKVKMILPTACVFIILFSSNIISGIGRNNDKSVLQQDSKSVQTKSKSAPTNTKTVQPKKKVTTASKSAQSKSKTGIKTNSTKTKTTVPVKTEEAKKPDTESVEIGNQRWEIANLNVSSFRNGDSIPQAKSNKAWVAAGDAGKPAWCYYNNNPANGAKYGKLYNWFAVNDPRGLAPDGWVLTSDEDWGRLAGSAHGKSVGEYLKSGMGWGDGYNGTNKSGFVGLPGGYRVENGLFVNLGSVGIWWSTTESRSQDAVDHYLSGTGSLGRSSSPKQRGESVRCIRPQR
jgi:uncharacterized protein (TIGR02145 family)